jgi:hypothetical protein
MPRRHELTDAAWCDAGSPPPNDFRLQPTGTGTGNATSEPLRLLSTSDGDALLTTYLATGQVDVSQGGRLQGGVATGMTGAVTYTVTADTRR